VSKMRGILEPHKMNKPACYSLQVWGPWLQQLYVLVAFTLTGLLWHKVMPLHNYGAFKFVLCLSKSASCWHEWVYMLGMLYSWLTSCCCTRKM